MTKGIGFETMRGAGNSWRGGVVLIANWLHTLRAHHRADTRLLLVEALHGTPVPSELIPLADGVVTYPHLRRFRPAWVWNHAQRRLLNKQLLPDKVLREQGVDVLICGVLERQTALPTLAVITDFQHRHLPEYFDAKEIAWRDAEFGKTAERATRVLVSGESVRADFETFAPQYADKVRVVPPISYIPEDIYARSPRYVLEKYSLPEKFAYLPNQFWQHKNHLVVFNALAELRTRGQNVFVVCTGHVGDSRNADYFSLVLQTLSRLGLREQVAILGSVPRADVFALIRQSAFVHTPSRFEGYGLSLDEARGVGKRVLASDLPAHREQNAPGVEYFSPTNADELAEKLGVLWQNTRAGPDAAMEDAARQAQPIRMRASAENLMQVVTQVLP